MGETKLSDISPSPTLLPMKILIASYLVHTGSGLKCQTLHDLVQSAPHFGTRKVCIKPCRTKSQPLEQTLKERDGKEMGEGMLVQRGGR